MASEETEDDGRHEEAAQAFVEAVQQRPVRGIEELTFDTQEFRPDQFSVCRLS